MNKKKGNAVFDFRVAPSVSGAKKRPFGKIEKQVDIDIDIDAKPVHSPEAWNKLKSMEPIVRKT